MMRQTLDAGLPELGLDLPESARQTLCDFGAAVIKQNEVMNLTAITQPDQVAKLHLLDSLTVLTAADLRGKQIIDVGCGAGFPGVPLAIACPEARVTLLDSLGKRMKWLEENPPPAGRPRPVRHRPGGGSGGGTAGKLRLRRFPRGRPAEHPAGADRPLCEGRRRGAGHERLRRKGRAGRVYICDQKTGAEIGIGKGIFHRRGVPRGHRPAEDRPHAEAVPPPLREDQAVSTLRHFGK